MTQTATHAVEIVTTAVVGEVNRPPTGEPAERVADATATVVAVAEVTIHAGETVTGAAAVVEVGSEHPTETLSEIEGTVGAVGEAGAPASSAITEQTQPSPDDQGTTSGPAAPPEADAPRPAARLSVDGRPEGTPAREPDPPAPLENRATTTRAAAGRPGSARAAEETRTPAGSESVPPPLAAPDLSAGSTSATDGLPEMSHGMAPVASFARPAYAVSEAIGATEREARRTAGDLEGSGPIVSRWSRRPGGLQAASADAADRRLGAAAELPSSPPLPPGLVRATLGAAPAPPSARMIAFLTAAFVLAIPAGAARRRAGPERRPRPILVAVLEQPG